MSTKPIQQHLHKAWFTASRRKLESLLPFLSEEDQAKVYDELEMRNHPQLRTSRNL